MSSKQLHDRIRVEVCKRKRTFFSEQTAWLAARGAKKLHPYACDLCGHFHLTSQKKRGQKRDGS